jgi:Family of unknown function (DUF5994)
MAHDINDSITARGPAPLPDRPYLSAARLSLAAGAAHRGALDGGWWPRSHDAWVELPELATTLVEHLGRVTHLAVDPYCWERIPADISIAGRRVKVGRFPGLGHMVAVIRGRMDTFLLLVVPPEAARACARAALSESATGTASERPDQILAACDISTAPTTTATTR